MAVSAVHHQGIDAPIDEQHGPVEVERPHRGGDPEFPVCVAVRAGVLPFFENVAHRYDADQTPLAVHDRKAFDLVCVHRLKRALGRDVLRRRDQFPGHVLRDLRLAAPGQDRPDVPAADDTDHLAPLDDGHAPDTVQLHDPFHIGDRGVRADRHDLALDEVFGLFDDPDLGHLAFRRHIPVDDPDAAFPGHRYRHHRLGHRIHGGAHERDIQGDVAREPRPDVGLVGLDPGFGGFKQHVVERKRCLHLHLLDIHTSPEHHHCFLDQLGPDRGGSIAPADHPPDADDLGIDAF
ncbi:hypothetical protein DSECCO2_573820 [anaerobic digester metagenome]